MAKLGPRAAGRFLRRLPLGPGVRGVVDRIEDAAVPGTFEVLRPAREIERRPPRSLEPLHPAFAALRSHRHPPVFRARLASPRVVGWEPLVLTADRRAVVASAFNRDELESNAVMHGRLPVAKRLRGRHQLLTMPWARNHFHWILDALPRAALLPLDELASEPVIVPSGLSANQLWSLERVGISAERLIPLAGEQIQPDELTFPSLVGGTGNPAPWVLDWLRDRLVPETRENARRCLYVSRADAARRVVNEDDVMAVLEPLGFELILPGALPLAEQLRAFASATAVVGPHGAGLVSLLACVPGTRVVELFDRRYVNGCYYAVSDARGLDYWYVTCEGEAEGDIRVDIARLKQTLMSAGIT